MEGEKGGTLDSEFWTAAKFQKRFSQANRESVLESKLPVGVVSPEGLALVSSHA